MHDEELQVKERHTPFGGTIFVHAGDYEVGRLHWTRPEIGYTRVKHLHVEPAWRGQGIATGLLNQLRRHVEKHHPKTVVITNPHSTGEMRLYARGLGSAREYHDAEGNWLSGYHEARRMLPERLDSESAHGPELTAFHYIRKRQPWNEYYSRLPWEKGMSRPRFIVVVKATALVDAPRAIRESAVVARGPKNGRVYLTTQGMHLLSPYAGVQPVRTLGSYIEPNSVKTLQIMLENAQNHQPKLQLIRSASGAPKVIHHLYAPNAKPFTHEFFDMAHAREFQRIHQSPLARQTAYGNLRNALKIANEQSGGNGAIVLHATSQKYKPPSEAIKTIRHERTHQNRQIEIGPASQLFSNEESHQALAGHPHWTTAAGNLWRLGYRHQDVGSASDEILARLSTGDYADMGLNGKQGAELFNHMLNIGLQHHGDDFRNIFRQSNPESGEK